MSDAPGGGTSRNGATPLTDAVGVTPEQDLGRPASPRRHRPARRGRTGPRRGGRRLTDLCPATAGTGRVPGDRAGGPAAGPGSGGAPGVGTPATPRRPGGSAAAGRCSRAAVARGPPRPGPATAATGLRVGGRRPGRPTTTRPVPAPTPVRDSSSTGPGTCAVSCAASILSAADGDCVVPHRSGGAASEGADDRSREEASASRGRGPHGRALADRMAVRARRPPGPHGPVGGLEVR
jgi:hypothetical protein